VVWEKGKCLRSAERVAILYLDRTLLIATDTHIAVEQVPTRSDWEPLLRIQSLLECANQAEGRDAKTATTKTCKKSARSEKRTLDSDERTWQLLIRTLPVTMGYI